MVDIACIHFYFVATRQIKNIHLNKKTARILSGGWL